MLCVGFVTTPLASEHAKQEKSASASPCQNKASPSSSSLFAQHCPPDYCKHDHACCIQGQTKTGALLKLINSADFETLAFNVVLFILISIALIFINSGFWLLILISIALILKHWLLMPCLDTDSLP